MPGKVKVKVLAGRNLPVMDRASDTSDAFVEVKLGNTTFKTDVYRKSLNPHWNSEWFKFEMEDEDLQDEPLQIRVMDYDTYSANDAIGKVYIDLNPLLLYRDLSSALSGWIPIYDTMHGIRGEVNVIVKVELFSDLNRFRDSSCGIQFFCGAGIPHGFKVTTIHGFVEELVVNDDPEYQWIDKIRTPRASNEARQTLFSKLSGEVQRKIGLKALELGGNAVVGYKQCFDLEGESGIVVRGIGTSVTLVRQIHELSQHASSPIRETTRESPGLDEGQLSTSPVGTSTNRLSQSPAKYGIGYAHKSYESDPSFTTPKASTLSGTGSSTNASSSHRQQRMHVLTQESLDMMEYPFLSMTQLPPGFIIHLGGVVSARSVKLLGRMNNPDEPETRDTWWTELRMEIRAHSRALGCNVVLGYSEATSISDDVCLLSASGTGAMANFNILGSGAERHEAVEKAPYGQSLEKEPLTATDVGSRIRHMSEGNDDCTQAIPCSICHIPYLEASVPFPVALVKCALCGKSRVPDLLFTTIEMPYNIPTTGKGCLVQARVCRPKKDAKGEANAREIGDSLPFLEYDLHRQLLIKLKAKGMNALFGLRIQVSIGAKMIIAVATSTGIYLTPLPQPTSPKISAGKTVDGHRSESLKYWIDKTITEGGKTIGIQPMVPQEKTEDVTDIEDDLAELDLSSGNKDTCVLEIDDSEDLDILTSLVDPDVPNGFDVFNTEEVSGVCNIACNLQMFTRVWRSRIPSTGLNTGLFSQMCQNTIQSLFFKLRKMVPCALSNLQFFVDASDDDEVQIIALGTTVGLGDPNQLPSWTPASSVASTSTQVPPKPLAASLDTDSDLMFKMDKEQGVADEGSEMHSHPSSHRVTTGQVAVNMEKSQSSEFKPVSVFTYHIASRHHGIDISSISYIPGARIEHYFGNLNFFFIRECTALRESGGLSGFIQSFIAEVFAIVRAHVAALGGNALVSFFMNQCVLMHNPHKNQGQCLINVGGDAVFVVLPMVLQPAPDGHRAKRASSPTVPTSQVDAARVVVKARGSPKEVKTLHFVSQG